jgi:hypothetical protein
MEPLCVLHLRLASIGAIPWSVFSEDALDALVTAVERGDLGRVSIVEFEEQQLLEAA